LNPSPSEEKNVETRQKIPLNNLKLLALIPRKGMHEAHSTSVFGVGYLDVRCIDHHVCGGQLLALNNQLKSPRMERKRTLDVLLAIRFILFSTLR
jgi:hypothetical protein